MIKKPLVEVYTMSIRYNFTEKFQKELRKILSKNIPIQLEKELDTKKIKAPVDLYYTDANNKDYIIELEIHRTDPSNNIAKISLWLKEEKSKRDVTVIQVFSPHYTLKSGNSAKKDISIHLGEQLIEKIHCQKYYPLTIQGYKKEQFNELYKSFKPDDGPSQENCQSMKQIAHDVAKQILDIILSA